MTGEEFFRLLFVEATGYISLRYVYMVHVNRLYTVRGSASIYGHDIHTYIYIYLIYIYTHINVHHYTSTFSHPSR